MRYRLRTLVIVLALGPPVLAGAWQVAEAKLAEWRRPRLTWAEALRQAKAVRSRGRGLIAVDKTAAEPATLNRP